MEDVELTPESLLLWERACEEQERHSRAMVEGQRQHYGDQPFTVTPRA